MPFIEVIEHQDAQGPLKEIYDDLVKSRGKLASVHKIQSLNPETIVAHMELYMKIMFSKSPLRRVQREMIAVVVSSANKCKYCIRHHGEAVQFFWKDEVKVKQLEEDYKKLDLSEKNRALCDFARLLTINPLATNDPKHSETLRNLGLTDRMILDSALVIAYFNFVNRLVLGLGVHLESEGASGYKYD